MSASLIQQYYVSEEGYVECKALYLKRMMTVFKEKVPTNFVPAVAVIRRGRALLSMIGRKG